MIFKFCIWILNCFSHVIIPFAIILSKYANWYQKVFINGSWIFLENIYVQDQTTRMIFRVTLFNPSHPLFLTRVCAPGGIYICFPSVSVFLWHRTPSSVYLICARLMLFSLYKSHSVFQCIKYHREKEEKLGERLLSYNITEDWFAWVSILLLKFSSCGFPKQNKTLPSCYYYRVYLAWSEKTYIMITLYNNTTSTDTH